MADPNDAPTIEPLQALSDAKESAEVRRHYLQNLVHELSSPLTPLIGYISLFEKQSIGPLSELQERCVGRMSRCAERLRRVLDDVGDVLNMEAGTYRHGAVAVNLGEVMRQVLEDVSDDAEEGSIEILTDFPSNLSQITIPGDERRLLSALRHLLWNAIKFNSAGGKALVQLVANNEHVRIDVLDTGVGVSPDAMSRIFEPFYQSDHSETRQFGGAGLGLTIVDWVTKLHGGDITIESPPVEQPEGHFFRGVRATLTLPRELAG